MQRTTEPPFLEQLVRRRQQCKRKILQGRVPSDSLMRLYDPRIQVDKRAFTIHVNRGNIRYSERHGIFSINVQQQLQSLEITYKPWGTHITIDWPRKTLNEIEGTAIAKKLADKFGNMEHTLILEAWGQHSVFIKGLFPATLKHVIETPGNDISMTYCLHVELRSRRKVGEQCVEVEIV